MFQNRATIAKVTGHRALYFFVPHEAAVQSISYSYQPASYILATASFSPFLPTPTEGDI